MKRVSFIRSHFQFQQRVLFNGRMRYGCSLREVEEKLFFNQIFINNMREMFLKYSCDEIIEEFYDNLKEYVHNIELIIDRLNDLIEDISIQKSSNFFQDFLQMPIHKQTKYTSELTELVKSRKDANIIEAPINPPSFQLNDFFNEDILLEYPLMSFDIYLEFLRLAASSNEVSSIYISLYRVAKDPSIFNILRMAFNNGIYVHVNVELKASMEHINRMWVDKMRAIGIHVTTYREKKVHCKLTLVRFKDGRQITQVGTGNYHTRTTTQYTDLSLITSNTNISNQVRSIFRKFDGGVIEYPFDDNILVTGYNTRKVLKSLIRAESKKGKSGYIAIKCNALDDDSIIEELHSAAMNGSVIDLIIRGVCTWIPTQPNVTVKSIVWNKLEHSRIFSFGTVNPTIYIGSLDLVKKKIDERIEVMVKIRNRDNMRYLCEYLHQCFTNHESSWRLMPSGNYMKENSVWV